MGRCLQHQIAIVQAMCVHQFVVLWRLFRRPKAQADFLRPHGLHPVLNPCDEIPGLDIFQGITFTPLHMIYEGNVQVFIERSFQLLQEKLDVITFNQVGCVTP